MFINRNLFCVHFLKVLAYLRCVLTVYVFFLRMNLGWSFIQVSELFLRQN